MKKKFSRIKHLPWSLGATPDDLVCAKDEWKANHPLKGKFVVITEKLDGECTTMYHNGIHARSLDSRDHQSRHWVKSFHATLAHEIPASFRIVGENVYAKHSIQYEGLPSYFLVFMIFDDESCLGWADTVDFCGLLGLQTVPVLYEGIYDQLSVRACYTGQSHYEGKQEGYVIRNANEIREGEFTTNVFKFVRSNHVTTNEHWMYDAVVRNGLKQI